MIRTVQIGKYKLFADDQSEDPRGDITGLKILENGINFETHVYSELLKYWPKSVGFLDIGANVGLYTVSAKDIRPDMPVVAIEVSKDNAQLLLRSLAENGITGVSVLNIALADRCRILQKNLCKTNAMCIANGTWNDGNWEYVFGLPLDFFNLPPIDLVKMDIEGFEWLALQGATKLLSQRPTFVFEYCPEAATRSGINPIQLLEFFVSRKYSITALDYVPNIRKTFLNSQECHDYVVQTTKWITDVLAVPQ